MSSPLVAHLVGPHAVEALDVLGPTLELLIVPDDDRAACLMRGTIPPGGAVPLHSHPEPETFIALAGEVEGLAHPHGWVRIGPGAVFHVPGGARHAFRNRSGEPAVSLVVTTARLAHFFREVGVPAGGASAAPSPETLERFARTAARYGHWLGTPRENAEVGLSLPPTAPGRPPRSS